jgi:hypothetical protein
MAPLISAEVSRVEMASDEYIEVRRGSGCLRRERGDIVSCAFSLRRLVVKQCITGAGCHERVGIGAHRVNGVPIVIEGAMPCSARRARIRLQYSSPTGLHSLYIECLSLATHIPEENQSLTREYRPGRGI